jgi:predicted nucleic acid-binding protein
MRGIVVDASITANWILPDEKSPIAQWALLQMQSGTPAFVPSLWLLEMSNLLFNAHRRKRVDLKYRDAALDRLERIPFTMFVAPTYIDLKVLRFYAEKYQLTVYDAEYLRVAKEHKLVLASNDGNLIAAAKREKVPVATAT